MSELYCPQCAAPGFASDNGNRYQCHACQFEIFRNVAAAVGAVMVCDEQVLMVQRSKAPQAGKWDLPGGFVDPDESAEQALKRECQEELGLNIMPPFEYLGAWPNRYEYQSLVYPTLDIFYVVILPVQPDFTTDKNEVSGIKWVPLTACGTQDMAFQSGAMALKTFLQTKS